MEQEQSIMVEGGGVEHEVKWVDPEKDAAERKLADALERITEIEHTFAAFLDPPKPEPPKLEPDQHWSFKALPKDTDTVRILDEADAAGARAVGATICGQPMVAMKFWDIRNAAGKMQTTRGAPFFGMVSPARMEANSSWLVWYVAEDPCELAKKMLAGLDAWANRKHRTTVAVFK